MIDLYSHIYEHDLESKQRIAKVTVDYPLSLYRCAEILELAGPAVNYLGPELFMDWFKDALQKDDLLQS